MRRRDKGFTLIELLIVVAIILVIAAIAIPNLSKQRITGNETAAIIQLKNLNAACMMYLATFGTFPKNGLADLQPPTAGANPDATHAGILDQVLARDPANKSGYTFRYTPGTPDTSGNVSSYKIIATPTNMNSTGVREFFVDESGTIRYSMGTPADVSSSPI